MPESIYEEALYWELGLLGLAFKQQKEMTLIYKGDAIKGQELNILLAGEVLVELKAMAKLPEVSTAHASSNLKATGLKHALLTSSSDSLCEL